MKRLSAAFLLLDTKASGTNPGTHCEARRRWLARQLEAPGPVVLFMHHSPFQIGINAMDAIMMQGADPFFKVIGPPTKFAFAVCIWPCSPGHLGNWRGINHSCLCGLNHRVVLDLDAPSDRIKGNFEPLACGVALLTEDQITVHMHDFDDGSTVFHF